MALPGRTESKILALYFLLYLATEFLIYRVVHLLAIG